MKEETTRERWGKDEEDPKRGMEHGEGGGDERLSRTERLLTY